MEPKSAPPSLTGGPYRSGKTTRLINVIIDCKRKDPLAHVVIAVPSARAQSQIKQRIFAAAEAAGVEGLFGVEIVPFYHLCRKILDGAGVKYKVLPDKVRLSLVADIIHDMSQNGSLESLKPVAQFSGTAQAVAELIDEFTRAAISPSEVITLLERQARDTHRYLELARIYQSYWEKQDRIGYFDQKRLALKCREVSGQSSFKPDFFAFDGFDRISKLQAHVLEIAANSAGCTAMTFDYDFDNPENPDYKWKQSSVEILRSVFKPEIEILGSERNLFPQPVWFKTIDRFFEMQSVAGRVKNLLVKDRCLPGDILVVCRSVNDYNEAMETAFEDAGLPFYIESSLEVRSLSPWHFLRNALELHKNDYTRRKFIDFIRSPYFNSEDLALSAEDKSFLDRQSFSDSLVSGQSNWMKLAGSDAMRKTLASVFAILTPPESKSRYDFVVWIEDVIEKVMQCPASAVDARTRAAVRERESQKAVRSALRILLLDDELSGIRPSSYEDMLNHLFTLLDTTTFQRPHPRGDCVTIASAEVAPNRKFKHVFIAGCLEGEFPRRRRDRGFLSQPEVARWLSFGIDLHDPRNEGGFEKALFFSLLERASESVFLSYPEYGVSGDELTPSFYLKELEGTPYHSEISSLEPFAGGLSTPHSCRELLSAALWHENLDRAESACHILGLAEEFDAVARRAASVMARASGNPRNNYNGYLRDYFETGALSQTLPEAWTASKLGDYGKCPFRYWVNSILRLRPRDEPEDNLDIALRGEFYHKALELFFRDYMDSPIEKRAQADAQLRQRAFTAAINWLVAQKSFNPGNYWENEKKELWFRFNRFLSKELVRIGKESLTPLAFEAAFGLEKHGSAPALVVQSEDGPLRVRGSIDRIDAVGEPDLFAPAGHLASLANSGLTLKVIDYKLGSRLIKWEDVEAGRDLQIPIYAMAAEHSILPGNHVQGGCYLSINQAKATGNISLVKKPRGKKGAAAEEMKNEGEPDTSNDLKKVTEERIRQFASAIKNGDFSVSPSKSEVCKDCNHRNVCRIKEIGLRVRSDADADMH